MTPPRILRLPEVCERTGLGRDSVYRLASEGRFPRPLKLSSRASGWIEGEVSGWIERRAAERESVTA
jgi:prophage regulatory protein